MCGIAVLRADGFCPLGCAWKQRILHGEEPDVVPEGAESLFPIQQSVLTPACWPVLRDAGEMVTKSIEATAETSLFPGEAGVLRVGLRLVSVLIPVEF